LNISPSEESMHARVSPHPPLLSEEYVPRTMPAVLGRWDLFFMYVCALFLLTNAVVGASGGTVSLLYLILGALLFFVPCVVVAAQLGVLMPHEGALYNWTYHALGTYWSLFVGLLYWVTGVLAIITACDAFVTILQGLNNA
jgi:amino acid transporter